ncbi:MAG: metallophosphoesterase [Spirochaetaceae bacterium]|jgi:predicted MPP superfamily phosphohydrolase|nr:metallophosphoesterase [Spirochaetaceae bacterium]
MIPIIAFLFASCATEASLVTREYTLQSEKITDGSGIKVAVLSDTHSQQFQNGGKRIVDILEAAKPDLIFLVGDIIDNVLPFTGSEILLSNIKHIASIYYVPGNHEYYNDDIEAVFAVLKKYDIPILRDESLEIEVNGNSLILAGADDIAKKRYWEKKYDMEASGEKAFSPLVERGEYKILLVHRPDYVEFYTQFNFDLILCGHTHGGQIRLPPFFNGLYAPRQGFFPKYAGGQYQLGSTTLIINRGITTTRPMFPRINNPPEIAIIEIQ